MGDVISVEFDKHERLKKCAYQADVYTFNMEKYQYTLTVPSIEDAYSIAVKEALKSVQAIRCIALYLTEARRTDEYRELVKVWQQFDPIFGELKEY